MPALGLEGRFAMPEDGLLADPDEITDAAMMNTQSLNIHYRTLDLAQGRYAQAGASRRTPPSRAGRRAATAWWPHAPRSTLVP